MTMVTVMIADDDAADGGRGRDDVDHDDDDVGFAPVFGGTAGVVNDGARLYPGPFVTTGFSCSITVNGNKGNVGILLRV